jgi:hypothetical protein
MGIGGENCDTIPSFDAPIGQQAGQTLTALPELRVCHLFFAAHECGFVGCDLQRPIEGVN